MAKNSSTSSSSDGQAGGVPLPRIRWITLALLLTLAGLEVGVRSPEFNPGEEVSRRLSEFDARPETGTKDLVILGTCLARALNTDALERTLGSEYRIHNLGFDGSFILDWYLIAENHVLTGPDISTILILFGEIELSLARSPDALGTHASDFASWNDIFVATNGVFSDHGIVDYALSMLLRSYRYRTLLGVSVWHMLGTEKPGLIPRDAEEISGHDLIRLAPADIEPIETEQAWDYLGRLVALAHESGAEVIFVPLPSQGCANYRDSSLRPADISELETKIVGIGGELLDVRGEAALGPEHFKDNYNLNAEGSERFLTALGRALNLRREDGP